MNLQTTLKELSARMGPPKERAAFGTWVPAAWLVRGLVEQGHGISDAVNQVIKSLGHANNKRAFGSLRAAYYKVRDQEWPAAFANEDDETQGFE